MSAKKFRAELDIAGFVHAMNVAESGGNGEHWADSAEGFVHVPYLSFKRIK